MYSITYIQAGTVRSISSPNKETALDVFAALVASALHPRLWSKGKLIA